MTTLDRHIGLYIFGAAADVFGKYGYNCEGTENIFDTYILSDGEVFFHESLPGRIEYYINAKKDSESNTDQAVVFMDIKLYRNGKEDKPFYQYSGRVSAIGTTEQLIEDTLRANIVPTMLNSGYFS